MACSSSYPPGLIPVPQDHLHSQLEVDLGQNGHAFNIPDASGGKIIDFDAGKEVDNDRQAPEKALSVSQEPFRPSVPPLEQPKHSPKRRRLVILLSVLLALSLGAGIGGGVGGSAAVRGQASGSSTAGSHTTRTPSQPPQITRTRPPIYANTGLAAVQWTDLEGVLHKRLYYQDPSAQIVESAWDNSSDSGNAWQVSSIGDAAKPGTPIAAAVGYPHASYNYDLVKNVYYVSSNNHLVERGAPSENPQTWGNDNFSGLYTAANASFLAAYWHQNIQNTSQELVILFQKENFANGITQARYLSDEKMSYPWVSNNFGFSHPSGSNFAIAPASYRDGKRVMLYTVGNSKALQQHEYKISDDTFVSTAAVSLDSSSATGLTLDPRVPLAVVAQDNTALYTSASTRQCMYTTPLANLIIYAMPNRGSLALSAWNCTTGFIDRTSDIKVMQKNDTTFLALTAATDETAYGGFLYVMFDSGDGPEIEEWRIPNHAGDTWNISSRVTTNFAL
ncbi:MAG: hypothetical protein Q9183_001953 [Haloplaca sp. 2 TL-2023]